MNEHEHQEDDTYRRYIVEAIAALRSDRFAEAEEFLQRAIARDYSRPEAFNVLGILREIAKDRPQAQNYYRAALSLDPTYTPARNNLDRTVGFKNISAWDLGDA